MNKKIVRDYLRLAGAILCIALYLPHLLVFAIWGG